MPLLPSSPIQYLALTDFPLYAPSVIINVATQDDQTRALGLIERAGAMIVGKYRRTGEIITVSQEVIELSDDNMGHLLHNPIQMTSTGFLDTTQGDLIEARYSATMYPYAAMFGAPQWQTIDPSTVDIQPNLARIWMPPGLFPIPYAEARLTYRAGFCPVGGPYPEWLKQGCGLLIENIVQRSGGAVVQATQLADQQQVKFWDNSFFTPQVESVLAPLKLRMWR